MKMRRLQADKGSQEVQHLDPVLFLDEEMVQGKKKVLAESVRFYVPILRIGI